MNTWIENHNKISEWIWEAENVPEWWTDLLQGKKNVSDQTQNNRMHVIECSKPIKQSN